MRKIKCRGKHLISKEWLIGNLFIDSDGRAYISQAHHIESLSHVEFSRSFIEVDPDTVGEFTELLDKNGKEIYEGDIAGREVSGIRSATHIIEYSDCGLSAKCLIPGASFFFNISKVLERYYVIGNIHDNPNLLTDKI